MSEVSRLRGVLPAEGWVLEIILDIKLYADVLELGVAESEGLGAGLWHCLSAPHLDLRTLFLDIAKIITSTKCFPTLIRTDRS